MELASGTANPLTMRCAAAADTARNTARVLSAAGVAFSVTRIYVYALRPEHLISLAAELVPGATMAKSEEWGAVRATLCVACLALCLVAVADYRGVEGPVALASGWVLPAPRMQSSFPVLAR
jgi:hypothetical protein